MPRRQGAYRLCTAQFFLTYPQCDGLTKEIALEAIMIALDGHVKRYLIAEELHRDGGLHLHCYIQTDEKREISDQRFFDIKHANKIYHGRYEGCRSPKAVMKYCTKEGDFISDFYKLDPWRRALSARSIQEAMEIIKEERPREWILNYQRIMAGLQQAFPIRVNRRFTMSDFNMEPVPTDPAFNGNKCILLWGPTGTGKTNFALAHFNRPLLVRSKDDLKAFKDHDGIVFDDFYVSHWPAPSVIHLLDLEFDAPVCTRYFDSRIPAYTPRIFTANTDNPFYDAPGNPATLEQIEAIERRLIKVEVPRKCF